VLLFFHLFADFVCNADCILLLWPRRILLSCTRPEADVSQCAVAVPGSMRAADFGVVVSWLEQELEHWAENGAYFGCHWRESSRLQHWSSALHDKTSVRTVKLLVDWGRLLDFQIEFMFMYLKIFIKVWGPADKSHYLSIFCGKFTGYVLRCRSML